MTTTTRFLLLALGLAAAGLAGPTGCRALEDDDPDAAVSPDAAAGDGDATPFDGAVGGDPDGPPPPDAPPPDAPPPDAPDPCPPLEPPATPDRWSTFDGLADAALAAALRGAIDDHTVLGYNTAKDRLFGTSGIDVHGGQVECVYTGLLYARTQLDDTDGYNTEHSWPQSEFPGGTNAPESDLHHLFPSTMTVNSRRGSLPFGETDCDVSACIWQGWGSEIGPRIGTGERVFEVRPPRRGDIARAHFYFSVRYAASISANEEATLRRWNRCDPPDDAERARNDAIEGQQDNRNPFVDRPEMVDRIADF